MRCQSVLQGKGLITCHKKCFWLLQPVCPILISFLEDVGRIKGKEYSVDEVFHVVCEKLFGF